MDRPGKLPPFTRMCQQFGALHRLLPPRTPRLNGKVELSHQIDEQEFYRLRRSGTRAELQRAFARWLWHYNHTRIHLGLDGRTPFEALRAFPEYKQLKGLKCYPC